MTAPILVDAAAAATFAGVEPDTIHQWASRGRITRHGTRSNRLYDLREIQLLVRDTPTRTGAR